jgi:hypothetical protein
MGPLYHLVRAADRAEAVRLALSRLKPGGKIYGSFILAFAGIIYDLKNGPAFCRWTPKTAQRRRWPNR